MAGTPDVLTSAPVSLRRRWLILGLALAAVGIVVSVVLIDGGADGTEPVAPPAASSSVPSTDQARPTSATIDPADRITGSLPPPAGLPMGTAAIEAAQAVADSYCEQISSWRLTIDGENGEYLQVVVLLRPAGPAYRDVALRIELTWDDEHYNWAGSRTALESCP